MKRYRFSMFHLAATVAVLALDLAVIRSLFRYSPGSNQTLYLVPIDGTHRLAFGTFALGVLPMASLLVLATIFQVQAIRRLETLSPSRFGFLAFGWLSVFLFMTCAALSPPAVQAILSTSLTAVGGVIAPLIPANISDQMAQWLDSAFEIVVIVILFLLPELAIAFAGSWLLGRSTEPRRGHANRGGGAVSRRRVLAGRLRSPNPSDSVPSIGSVTVGG